MKSTRVAERRSREQVKAARREESSGSGPRDYADPDSPFNIARLAQASRGREREMANRRVCDLLSCRGGEITGAVCKLFFQFRNFFHAMKLSGYMDGYLGASAVI